MAKGFQETKQDFGGIESETIALSVDLKTMFLWFLLLEWGIEKKSTSAEVLPMRYLREVSSALVSTEFGLFTDVIEIKRKKDHQI